MGMKRGLFLMFVFGVSNNHLLGMDKLLPSLRFEHTTTTEYKGFEKGTAINTEIYLMDQETLNRFKKADKENNYAVYMCLVPGFPKRIIVFNPTHPSLGHSYPDSWLNVKLNMLSQERQKIIANYLSSENIK